MLEIDRKELYWFSLVTWQRALKAAMYQLKYLPCYWNALNSFYTLPRTHQINRSSWKFVRLHLTFWVSEWFHSNLICCVTQSVEWFRKKLHCKHFYDELLVSISIYFHIVSVNYHKIIFQHPGFFCSHTIAQEQKLIKFHFD